MEEEKVVIDPNIHFGKPCIAGTRIPVHDVLELIKEGLSFSQIIDNYYPDLKVGDIRACVQYAIDAVETRTRPGLTGTSAPSPLDQEVAAFAAIYPQLRESYLGEWIAIYDQKLVDHDWDGATLYWRIRTKYGRTLVLIRQVTEQLVEEFRV